MPVKNASNDDWRNDPITDRQRDLIEEKGFDAPNTKGEASDLISEILSREDKATESQIRRLEFYGIYGDFSKKEAMELIEKNKPLHDEDEYQEWKKIVCKIDPPIKPIQQPSETGAPSSTVKKDSPWIMGALRGLVYAFRIATGIFITILALAAFSESFFAFGMFLVSAFLAFPFLSKKLRWGFVAKWLIFAGCFFAATILFANSSNKKIAKVEIRHDPAGPVKDQGTIQTTPAAASSIQVDWNKYAEEFKKKLREDGGLVSKVNKIDVSMDNEKSSVKAVLSPEELNNFSKIGPLKKTIDVLLEGLVVLQVQFAKEKNLSIKGRFFAAYLHIAEDGILNPVRFKKLGMASYNPNTDSVDINYK
jgi:hypothetical protein